MSNFVESEYYEIYTHDGKLEACAYSTGMAAVAVAYLGRGATIRYCGPRFSGLIVWDEGYENMPAIESEVYIDGIIQERITQADAARNAAEPRRIKARLIQK